MTLEFSGKYTEVLIVGSQHIGPGITDDALAGTFARFLAWQPDLVGIEVLSGELVGLYHEQGGWLAELQYGGFPVALKLGLAAQAFTGWTRVQGVNTVQEAEDARTRVLAYLVAFEPYNALLHWTPELDLPPELAEGLRELADHKSEGVRLGVNLARRLGHARVALLDDFPMYQMPADWWAEYEAGCKTPEFKAWLENHPCMVNGQRASQQAREAGDYWPILQHLNSRQGVLDNEHLENQANLKLGRPGRAKQADWDARNLFMAARLRLETARIPGGKLLFIVGSSHKGPMEAALRALSPDLRIVELGELNLL